MLSCFAGVCGGRVAVWWPCACMVATWLLCNCRAEWGTLDCMLVTLCVRNRTAICSEGETSREESCSNCVGQTDPLGFPSCMFSLLYSNIRPFSHPPTMVLSLPRCAMRYNMCAVQWVGPLETVSCGYGEVMSRVSPMCKLYETRKEPEPRSQSRHCWCVCKQADSTHTALAVQTQKPPPDGTPCSNLALLTPFLLSPKLELLTMKKLGPSSEGAQQLEVSKL